MEIDKGQLSVAKVVIIIIAVIGYVSWFYQSVIIPIAEIKSGQTALLNLAQDNKEFQKERLAKDAEQDNRLDKLERNQ